MIKCSYEPGRIACTGAKKQHRNTRPRRNRPETFPLIGPGYRDGRGFFPRDRMRWQPFPRRENCRYFPIVRAPNGRRNAKDSGGHCGPYIDNLQNRGTFRVKAYRHCERPEPVEIPTRTDCRRKVEQNRHNVVRELGVPAPG